MTYKTHLASAKAKFWVISRLVGGGENPKMFTKQSRSAKTAHNAQWTDKLEQIVMYLPQANRGRQLFDELASPRLIKLWTTMQGKHRNVCSHATPGCRAACLGNSGHLGISGGAASRAMLARYVMLCLFPYDFWLLVDYEIGLAKKRVGRCGKTLVCRINGTSDLDVVTEAYVGDESILSRHPDVDFQDYTKRPLVRSGWRTTVPNYYLVRSATERDDRAMFDEHQGNIVVPVNLPKGAALPDTFMGRPVIDGDVHDLRCADTPRDERGNYAVLVRVKKRTDGKRPDTHGFIREVV